MASLFTYLYHPMNSPTSDYAYRQCGWHYLCNNDPNNPEASDADRIGLDWSSHPFHWEPTNKKVWLRWKMLGGDSPTYVASGQTTSGQYGGCDGVRSRVLRASDGAYIADIWNLHTERTGTRNHIFYSNTPAATYAGDVGTLKNPVGDPCSSWWHTMQFPILLQHSVAYGASKNANIPNEVGYTQPVQGYPIWSQAEYIIFFPK